MLGAALFLIIPCHLFIAYIIELVAADNARTELRLSRRRSGTETPTPTDAERKKFEQNWSLIAWLHTLNVTLALAITTYVVYFHIHHPRTFPLSPSFSYLTQPTQ